MYTRSYYRKENAASPPRAGTMRNLLNKGGSLCDPVSPGRDQYEEGWFQWIEMSHSAQFTKKNFLEIDYS
jgi:hypothetical protein